MALNSTKFNDKFTLFIKIRSTELCVTFYIEHIYSKHDLKYGNSAIQKKMKRCGRSL
jgi:hypothetical protein